MPPKAGLVLTTIAEPIVLESYHRNFAKYGHLHDITAYVIPDKRTPGVARQRCEDLKRRGMRVVFPDLEAQESFLREVCFPPELVPYNSDNRRNVGYLMALSEGNDFVISIDDDNYCDADHDFYREHAVVCGESSEADVVHSDSGWFNICDLLEIEPTRNVYARGFPYFSRHRTPALRKSRDQAIVRVNAGLWLSDPDMDGMSWLVSPVRVTGFKGESLVLGHKTWSPINTQNTALARDVIASYYFVRMGYPLAGFPIDRYGDIFSGYFSQACARHFAHAVRVGTPVADHRRNSHNYLKDALNEFACICVLEDLLPWLHELKLEGGTYCEAYTALSHRIEDVVASFTGQIWSDATRGYFHHLGYCMREWVKVCSRLGVE
jgi:hypothetical protein